MPPERAECCSHTAVHAKRDLAFELPEGDTTLESAKPTLDPLATELRELCVRRDRAERAAPQLAVRVDRQVEEGPDEMGAALTWVRVSRGQAGCAGVR